MSEPTARDRETARETTIRCEHFDSLSSCDNCIARALAAERAPLEAEVVRLQAAKDVLAEHAESLIRENAHLRAVLDLTPKEAGRLFVQAFEAGVKAHDEIGHDADRAGLAFLAALKAWALGDT